MALAQIPPEEFGIGRGERPFAQIPPEEFGIGRGERPYAPEGRLSLRPYTFSTPQDLVLQTGAQYCK